MTPKYGREYEPAHSRVLPPVLTDEDRHRCGVLDCGIHGLTGARRE
jgi:hypothetical protein